MSQKRPPQRPRRSSRISSSSCPRRGLEPSGVVVEMRPTPSTTWARNTRWTCVVAHMTTARRRCAPTRNDTTSPTTPCTQSEWSFFCDFGGCCNLFLVPPCRSHCTCDDMLHRCLRAVNSTASQTVGNIYFNLVQVPCLQENADGTYTFRAAREF